MTTLDLCSTIRVTRSMCVPHIVSESCTHTVCSYRFVVAMWKKNKEMYMHQSNVMAEAGIQIKVIDSSSDGPSTLMKTALWHTGDTMSSDQKVFHYRHIHGQPVMVSISCYRQEWSLQYMRTRSTKDGNMILLIGGSWPTQQIQIV